MRTIISFSGGTDSVFLLWKTLTETDDEVHVVRFLPKNVTDDLEQLAVDRMIPWYRSAARDFSFEYVDYDTSEYKANWEMIHPLEFVSYSAEKINSGEYDRAFFGMTADNSGINGLEQRHAQKKLVAQLYNRGTLTYPLLEANMGRAHALQQLPIFLIRNQTSCISLLQDGTSCKKCFYCHLTRVFLEDLAKGVDPDTITKEYNEFRENLRKGNSTDPSMGVRPHGGWYSSEHPKYGSGFGPAAYSVQYPHYRNLFSLSS